MKSLNDFIWNEDSDLEEGKKDDVIKSRMQQICLTNSCGVKINPECIIRNSYFSPKIICSR